jgi:diacylglycerol kinase (ATP)
MKFSFTKRIKSFVYAFRGIRTLVQTQHNAWVHLFVMISVITVAFVFQLSGFEWSLIITAITLVWLGEALNTAIEFLADTVTNECHPLIEKAKDVAAGGVLIAATGAALIGIIVYWPYFKKLVHI